MSGAMRELPEGLLDDIKVYLDITWDDEQTNRRITGLIEDGMAYLDDKLGEAGDYLSPGYPRTLLKEYVRYARDAALDVFENNYQSLILAMQADRGVINFVESCT
jgi:hypothetical protein